MNKYLKKYKYIQTPSILSATEYRRFWVKAGIMESKFTVCVGKGDETVPFIAHTWDNEPHTMPCHVAFSTGHGKTAYWEIPFTGKIIKIF